MAIALSSCRRSVPSALPSDGASRDACRPGRRWVVMAGWHPQQTGTPRRGRHASGAGSRRAISTSGASRDRGGWNGRRAFGTRADRAGSASAAGGARLARREEDVAGVVQQRSAPRLVLGRNVRTLHGLLHRDGREPLQHALELRLAHPVADARRPQLVHLGEDAELDARRLEPDARVLAGVFGLTPGALGHRRVPGHRRLPRVARQLVQRGVGRALQRAAVLAHEDAHAAGGHELELAPRRQVVVRVSAAARLRIHRQQPLPAARRTHARLLQQQQRPRVSS